MVGRVGFEPTTNWLKANCLNRAAGENVGVYGINQGDLALNSGNYDLSYQGNNLTITKALLNVIADAKTKVYGEPLLPP